MDSKDQKQQYKILSDNLDLVFNSNELKTYLSSNKDFQKIILNQISILNAFEEVLNIKETKSLLYLTDLVKFSNEQYKTFDVNIENKIDTLDSINYLNIYIDNIYKKKLTDFKKDVTSDHVVEEPKTTTDNSNKTGASFSNKGNIFSPYGIQSQKSLSPTELKENYFYDLAYKQIIEDINTGVFYLYDSKPKLIPILKKFYYLFAFIIGLVIFLSFIIATILMSSNSQLNYNNNIYSASSASILIYSLVLSIFFSYYGIKNIFKKPRNDNEKYYFDKRWIFIIVVFIVFQLYNFIPTVQALSNDNFWISLNSLNPASGNIIDILKMLYISEVTYFSLIIGFLFFGILISFFNPKKDINRMNEKLKTYIEKYKNEDIFK